MTPVLKTYVDDVVTVTHVQLTRQMRCFVETSRLAAAAEQNRIVDVSRARVGVIVNSSNIGINALGRLSVGNELGAKECSAANLAAVWSRRAR